MITLKDIIDEYMVMISDEEHYLYGINKTLVIRAAKRGMEDLHYSVVPEFATVVETLKSPYYLTLPEGTIDWIRISAKNPYNNQLIPLYRNNKNPLALGYLKDELGDLILDGDDNVMISISGTPGDIQSVDLDYFCDNYRYSEQYGAKFNIAGGVISYAGNYTYEPISKRFYFYDIPEDTQLFFEVIQLPNFYEVDESKLSVHEYQREALHCYITYHLIKGRYSVPKYEKTRALVEYNKEKRKSKKRLILKPEEIKQALKTQRGFLNKF